MPLRIAVLGAGGMLGHKMFQRLGRAFPDTTGILRGRPAEWQTGAIVTGVDAMDFERLAGVLRELRPTHIVNCIGVIKQRPEALDPVLAISINALLPHRLAELAAEWGGRLVHFSTDCVFSGVRGAYREDDPPDANDLYGRSKALGEVRRENALTLRTSIVGREIAGRRSLLEWLLARRGARVCGYRRVIWSGVTTLYAAQLVARILEETSELTGLYQVAARPLSKYELLCGLEKAYAADIEIIPDDTEASDRSLSGAQLRRAIGVTPPEWPAMLAELAADPTPYESW